MSINPKLEEILKRHKVGLFEFDFVRDGEYFLNTDEPISAECQRELLDGINAMSGRECTVKFGLIPKSAQPLLPGMPPQSVAHPAHYNAGKIEVIEAIEDWKLSYHRGNAVKYIARAGRKNPDKEIEDLQKSIWYLQREVENLTAAKEGREPMRPNDMNPRNAGHVAHSTGRTGDVRDCLINDCGLDRGRAE